MARYNMHPAQGGGHYHDVKLYKDRQLPIEEIKRRQEQKRLKKLRQRGGKS